jgi:predicted nucleotidyltransferase
MHPLLELHRAEIADLCRRFHVVRLDVFGSAARGSDFDPERSDVDFLVEFDRAAKAPRFAAFFELQDELARLLGRKVDLVMEGSVLNPYVRASIERAREPVYGA